MISEIRICDDECKIIVRAYVVSMLDYCNVLLESSLTKLYKSSNESKTLYKTSKDEHVTPMLHDFHWLPIELRVHSNDLL